ncbi:MAG TPA: hypothetical protein VJ851_02195 [Jatrophihabitans sp.]|nr:hypothetical protein [Jatrophihabitans sp.]
MVELPEHEERRIRDYVNSQSPADDQAGLVQKVGSHRIMGHVHEMYDVHCDKTRWWVITDPTNLYLQSDFPDVQQALIFHLGLGLFLAQRSRGELDESHEEVLSGSWRRYRQALDAMDIAGEAEDFQAIGIKCRDSLLAFVRDHLNDEWVGEVAERPKTSDFKGWAEIFAERLTEGRVRSYVKTLVDKVWDLAVWLQHNNDATPDDAELVLEATGNLLTTFGRLLHRREYGDPERCPRCSSYRLDEDVEVVEEPESGFLETTICGGCGWQSEQMFARWSDRASDADVAAYLERPTPGPSDRLGRNGR